MKILVQKVLEASVSVEGNTVANIKNGYLLFVGVEKEDTSFQADYLAKKIAHLRIFTDENDKMNLSIQDVGGEILAVSQFTLAADVSRGNRPGFETAARPDEAQPLYEYLVAQLKQFDIPVKTGIFQADMKVFLINDGPCTFMLQK
ncbi:MAG: D-tyrosyl-tRNA(Tyr) deacylase [Alphaproteobacteria bacterium]|nr:D-tyrosyl-tRNA(Tyr) deacylase [Alphaproteobacteria bacterium]